MAPKPTTKKSSRLAAKVPKQKGGTTPPLSTGRGPLSPEEVPLFLLPEIHGTRSIVSRAERRAPGHLISNEVLALYKAALEHLERPDPELLKIWPHDPDTLSPRDGIFVFLYFSGDLIKMQSLPALKQAAKTFGLAMCDCDELAHTVLGQESAKELQKAQALIGAYLSILENRIENIKSQLAQLDLIPDTDIFFEVPALKTPESAQKLLRDKSTRPTVSLDDQGKCPAHLINNPYA